MSSAPAPTTEDEHRRKRVRKGTRSCWECKRRKVKCQLSSEDVRVCSGCLVRGTTCLSQEYPEEHDPSGGTQIGERLGRVELLLEKLVSKISSYESSDETRAMQTPESLGNDVLTPYSGSMSNACDNAPVLSLFDNVVIGRRDVAANQSQTPTPPATRSVGVKTPKCRQLSKVERLRQTLIDLLPSQHATDLICEASNVWLLVHSLSPHFTDVMTKADNATPLSTFNLDVISKQHPTAIARTLLLIAVSLQQLPADFDTTELQLIPSADAQIEKYLSTVQALITSDDELVSTIGGLLCLVIQGVFHINAGNLRRAWLAFRRALNVGQLMGIHRSLTQTPSLASPAVPSSVEGRELWYQIVQADRYLGLLLGLPCGSADNEFSPEETFNNPNLSVLDRDLLFNRKLCNVAGRIMERNQAEYTHAYATTQEIDERLDNLAKDMPQSWWDIPPFIMDERCTDSAIQFDRLLTQIWYYQLEALLHLPFMLRAATERRYEYSKFSCLKASRENLFRYLALRNCKNLTFCCKVVDFGAFTATVTMLLGLLEPSHHGESREIQLQRESDRVLVRSVLNSMEELVLQSKDVVITQSVDVIKTLLAVDSASGHAAGNLRLTIPYFGTISISRTSPTPNNNSLNVPVSVQNQAFPGQPVTYQHWSGLGFDQNPMNVSPIVSFTSSQFPPLVPDPPMEDWGLQGADTMFFDSLLNTDIEGNWVF